MRLPQDYILHIESAKDGVHITAEWQGELVRCKDCKHKDLFSCPLADNDFQKDEDFCSWGERKGGDAEMDEVKPQYMQPSPNDGADLISRADAIKVFIDWGMKEFGFHDFNRNERFIDALSELPSAETHDKRTKTHACVDLISREDARKAFSRIDDLRTLSLGKIGEVLDALPTADRPQGEWIKTADGNGWNDWWVFKCPLCGATIEDKQYRSWEYNFCPNCGARMYKGGDDE